MNYDIDEIPRRLKCLREYLEFSPEFMAKRTSVTPEEYLALENGDKDISLSFLNECACALNVDLIELLTGSEPHLQKYTIVKNGQGLPIERRAEFSYQHLAYLFKKKKVEPLIVIAPYSEDEQNTPVHTSCHIGQEMDYIISGKLKFIIGSHVEILEPGDCAYYDSDTPHGMIAIDGEDCVFLAILI